MADSVNQPERSAAQDSALVERPKQAGKPAPGPTRKWFGRIIDWALWAMIAFALFTVFSRKDTGPALGQAPTAFELPLVGEDGALNIPGKLERPLLIKAFASWCGACKRAAWFDQLEDERRQGKLDVVAVSVDDTAAAALSAKNDWSLSMPVAHDPTGRFSAAYNVTLLPTYIYIGTDGKVARVTSGMPTPLDFRAWKGE